MISPIGRSTDTVSAVTTPPVLLVHGWGGSFASTWAATPLVPLLEDAGRSVIGVDLLGHGEAPKPHDPAAYADLTQRVEDALGDEPVDAVGFSLGAMTLLRLAIRRPGAFRRLVVAGVGENLFVRDDERHAALIRALKGDGETDNVVAQLFVQYASQPGNDRLALTAAMERTSSPIDPAELAAITCPTLVAIGDNDFAGPGDRLAAALPDSRLVVLKRTDHFATPESFAFIDATLEFLDAVPA